MNPYVRKLIVCFAGLCAVAFPSVSIAQPVTFAGEQALCAKGDQWACTNAGIMLSDGDRIAKDEQRGAQFFASACLKDSARACAHWGASLENGQGTKMDLVEARKAYEKACDKGDRESCNAAGMFFQTGKGLAINEAKAMDYYSRGCNMMVFGSGYGPACRNLGVLHADAVTLPQDRTLAVAAFDKACVAGDMDGCNKQAWHIEQGLGTRRNIEQARVLYAKACDGKFALACNNARLMTAKPSTAPTKTASPAPKQIIPAVAASAKSTAPAVVSSGSNVTGFSVCSAFMNEGRKMFFTQPFSAVEIRSKELALAYAQMLREKRYAAASMYAPAGSPPPQLTVDCRWHATQVSASEFKNKLVDGSARDRWTSVPTSFDPK